MPRKVGQGEQTMIIAIHPRQAKRLTLPPAGDKQPPSSFNFDIKKPPEYSGGGNHDNHNFPI